MILKILLMLACIGHIICAVTDCLLTYTPNGKFSFGDIKESKKMSELFNGMPLKNLTLSMLLGVLSFSMSVFGYAALSNWMSRFSQVYAVIMFISAILYFISVTAHHIFCGTMEWFYVRLGRTDEVLDAVLEYFKKTSVTMYVSYLALLVFAASFFIAVVSGQTSLPRWSCIFNTLPLFIILMPTKAPAKGSIAGAVMFLGLVFVI